jgi:hypothetical protein
MLNIKKNLTVAQIYTTFLSWFLFATQVAFAEGIKNPLGDTEDLQTVIASIVKGALGLTAVVAVGFIVYGGFLYITAAGDDAQIKKGKEALVGAIIGIIVIGLAYAIVAFVIGAMGAGGGGTSGSGL